MTREELRAKYGDTPNREDMTIEQEREFVSDWFSAYEQEGFAPVFWSPGGDYDEYHGRPFTVLGRTPEYDSQHPGQHTADLECLPMWNIRFGDGVVLAAYPEEIIPSKMRDNGCPEEYLKKD